MYLFVQIEELQNVKDILAQFYNICYYVYVCMYVYMYVCT